jgi:hypothetical protein
LLLFVIRSLYILFSREAADHQDAVEEDSGAVSEAVASVQDLHEMTVK